MRVNSGWYAAIKRFNYRVNYKKAKPYLHAEQMLIKNVFTDINYCCFMLI